MKSRLADMHVTALGMQIVGMSLVLLSSIAAATVAHQLVAVRPCVKAVLLVAFCYESAMRP